MARNFIGNLAACVLLAAAMLPPAATAQGSEWTLSNEAFRVQIAANGTISALQLRCGAEWEMVKFRADQLAGPSWAEVALRPVKGSNDRFAGVKDGVKHSLAYRLEDTRLAIVAALSNEGTNRYAPKAARLVFGLDTEMARYPEWNEHYFPTLLRCETTHFWGYFMSPRGRLLTIGSPDPVASYAMNYDPRIWGSGDGQHMIHTVSLDLLHALPLPRRHPQDQTLLQPGEERHWTIFLEAVDSLEAVKPKLAASLGAPMIEADRYSLAEGERSALTFLGAEAVTVTSPDGRTMPLSLNRQDGNRATATLTPESGAGLYTLTVTGADGRVSEGSISVRRPWSWYMKRAREEALRHQQYSSTHLEQWLGLTSGVLARRHLPDPELDQRIDQRLREILDQFWLWSPEKNQLVYHDKWYQPPLGTHAYRRGPTLFQMAGLTAQRYLADGDEYWLEWAYNLANNCMGHQHKGGNIGSYTSVFYPLKYIMTVMLAERTAMEKDEKYRKGYERHHRFVQEACEYLVRQEDNLDTEGQNTFEDGMLSCTGTQLGLFALMQTDPEARRKYAEAARLMLTKHRCLRQLLIPDARMNGATLRFWEAQYDVLIGNAKNLMNSPHGWSGWVIPGLWYQYLLTGEEEWLRMTMNALGTAVQLIDPDTGELRWAFTPDPYREVTMLEPDPENPGVGKRVERIIGEQYIPMISSFNYPRQGESVAPGMHGWQCDNDVHEIFIAMEEVALANAYVLERSSGELVSWNCAVAKDAEGRLTVTSAEDLVSRIHLNLRQPHQVKAHFAGTVAEGNYPPGMHWIGPGGVPEFFR